MGTMETVLMFVGMVISVGMIVVRDVFSNVQMKNVEKGKPHVKGRAIRIQTAHLMQDVGVVFSAEMWRNLVQ